MKVAAFIPLVLSSTVFAANHRSTILASRQAQIKNRGLVDVCVGLDLDINILDILPGGKPLIAGHLDLCLCLSVLPDFCKDHPVGQSVTNWLGPTGSQDYFTNLINTQPGHQQCTYPDHCDPICDVKTPCGFHCKDGFVPDNADHPTQCVCPAPHSVCNGVCGDFPNGCSSQTSHKKKRAPTCATGKTLCGVSGGSKGRGYDCVSTEKDLESCGGCVTPNPFQVPTPVGKDCSIIKNTDDVKCLAGVCVVSSCEDGYKVSSTGDSCDKISLSKRTGEEDVDDLVDLLIKQGLVADLANIAFIKEGLLAAVHVARRDDDDASFQKVESFLTVAINKGIFVGVTDLVGLADKLGLDLHVLTGSEGEIDSILDLCLKNGLIANVADLLFVKSGLLASLHIGRRDDDSFQKVEDFLTLAINKGIFVGITDLVALADKLGLDLHLFSGSEGEIQSILDLCLKNGLIANVADLLFVKSGLFATLHIARRDEDANFQKVESFLTVAINKGIFVGVTDLVALADKLGVDLHVLTGSEGEIDSILDLCLKNGLIANVADLLFVKSGLLASLHIGRRDEIDTQKVQDFLDLCIKQGLIAGVPDVAALFERLNLGLSIL